MNLKFSGVGFVDVELEHLKGTIKVDSISYSALLHQITVQYGDKTEVLKVNSGRKLRNQLIKSLFIDESYWDQSNTSFAVNSLIQMITEYMTEDDKRVVIDGEALLSCFTFEYKKTRNYTLLVEDHKLTDDEIFGGLLLGAGRADVYSAWELYFTNKKFLVK